MEEFLVPMELTQRELSQAILVPYQRVNELVNGRRGVTPSTALRLAKFFGVSADLFQAQQKESKHLELIQPYTVSADSAT